MFFYITEINSIKKKLSLLLSIICNHKYLQFGLKVSIQFMTPLLNKNKYYFQTIFLTIILLIITLIQYPQQILAQNQINPTLNKQIFSLPSKTFTGTGSNTFGESQSEDFNKISDSLKSKKTDSISIYAPIQGHGSELLLPAFNHNDIDKEDLKFINYATLEDIFIKKNIGFPLSLGMPGLYNTYSFYGAAPSKISFNFNGRPINDLEFGTLNLEQISPESFEKIEIFTGSDAAILADNAAGALINVQERKFDTKYPYTKLWYCQTAYNTLLADAIFAQNILPNFNFNFGFRTMGSDGMTNLNSTMQSWNVRGALRWNPSSRTSISLNENFTNLANTLNGGLQYLDSLPTIYNGMDNKVFRHDLTLSYSSFLSSDSAEALSGNIYYSHSLWDFNRNTYFINEDSSYFVNHLSHYFGINAKYEQNILNFFTLRVGGQIQNNDLPATEYNNSLKGLSYSAFAHGQLNFFDRIILSGGTRLTIIQGATALSLGAKSIFILDSALSIFGDISRSEALSQPSDLAQIVLKETHYLFIGGIEYIKGDTRIKAEGGSRLITNPIESQPVRSSDFIIINTFSNYGKNRFILSAKAEIETLLINNLFFQNHKIFGTVMFQSYLTTTDNITDSRYPPFYGNIDIFYQIEKLRSLLRVGVQSMFISSFKGQLFIPMTRQYLPISLNSPSIYDNFSCYLSARLGDAFIKLTIANLLSSKYYYVPINPNYDWHLLLSVSWAFQN